MAAKKNTVETVKKNRKMSTPEERIAKLEADLAAAKQRAEDKANKAVNLKRVQRAKLIEKREDLSAKIDQLTDEIGDGDAGDLNLGNEDSEQLTLEV